MTPQFVAFVGLIIFWTLPCFVIPKLIWRGGVINITVGLILLIGWIPMVLTAPAILRHLLA